MFQPGAFQPTKWPKLVFQLYTTSVRDPVYNGVNPIPTVDDIRGLYFSGDARIVMSTIAGVIRGIAVPVTEGVTGVVGGVTMGNVSIGVGTSVPPGFSVVQPVNRIAMMRIIPGRIMNGRMVW
jgi:hypothetical protein